MSGDSPLTDAKILAVDDELLIVLDVEMSVREAGAAVIWSCSTVDEAMKIAAKEDITAAVLDVRIGPGTPEPVAQQLRERGIPFLFYSGQDLPPAMAARFPLAPMLKKPLRPDGLIEALLYLILRSAENRTKAV